MNIYASFTSITPTFAGAKLWTNISQSVTALALAFCPLMMLQKLAGKYFHTRFIKVFVENVPFLVTKLGVKVLPAIFMFVDGISKDR